MNHAYALDKLVNHLEDINIDRRSARWVMSEGMWLYDNSYELHRFPDLIVVYDDHAVPVELKSNVRHRSSALQQLNNGRLFINQELDMVCPLGKFVVYNKKGFTNEDIYFGGLFN